MEKTAHCTDPPLRQLISRSSPALNILTSPILHTPKSKWVLNFKVCYKIRGCVSVRGVGVTIHIDTWS